MGLFSKKKKFELKNLVEGEVKPITEACDPVFAEKMMGDGILIAPESGVVVAPCKAEITLVFPTKHAIGLKLENGVSVLLHFGVDTVQLKGEGFEVMVSAGQTVQAGDVMWNADLAYLSEHAKSTDLMVIFSEPSENVKFEANYGRLAKDDTLLTIL